ncbi:MAG: hypothetical protein M0Q24_10630 [Sulfurimonas sp.]|uniref:hypothetical protein n=1 Tax=Sulfurimonas sp. TaxID=2022749 RepID=UPI0025DFB350|nr:hypothetical protein [Sulfurimonas sp.]MCK9492533.1 hypothetical protein [Sulfurimonas sp.]
MLKKIVFNSNNDTYIIDVIKEKLTIVNSKKIVRKTNISNLYYEDKYIGFLEKSGLIYEFEETELNYVFLKA